MLLPIRACSSLPYVRVMHTAGLTFELLVALNRWADPLPPRHFTVAAGIAGTAYDQIERQYAQIPPAPESADSMSAASCLSASTRIFIAWTTSCCAPLIVAL
jgi:hypothetical protein